MYGESKGLSWPSAQVICHESV